jgi:zinc and cadmium transporter
MIAYILASAFIIMLASLSGAVFAWKVLGEWLSSRLRYLIALAAGVFSVVVFGLVAEVVEHEGITLGSIAAFLLGGIVLEVMTRLLPKGTHHHHGPHHHTHTGLDARRMLIGDGVHNVHDGIILVPAFMVSPVVGIGTAVGILLHELVQEVSEFFVLRQAGYSVRKALLLNFLVSATILIGVGLAVLLTTIEALVYPLIAFSAGGFLYIVLRDLLPSIVRHAREEKQAVRDTLLFLVGAGLMALVSVLMPHAHHHEGEHHHEHVLPDGFELVLDEEVRTVDRSA